MKGKRGKVKRGKKSSSSSRKIKQKSFFDFFKKRLFVVGIFAAVLVIALIVANVNVGFTGAQVSGQGSPLSGDNPNPIKLGKENAPKVEEAEKGSWFDEVGLPVTLSNFLDYIFGRPLKYTGATALSGAIITIAVWLLIFLTFSDTIATFSSFSVWISWIVGFLITVITANFGFIVKTVAVMTAIFSFAGTLAVYVALGAAFAAFLLTNLGVWQARHWLMQRKALMEAAKGRAGGERLAGTVRGLGAIGRALEELGGK